MKYRKKPIEVEAMRFFSDSKLETYQWALTINENIELEFIGSKSVVIIPTLKGEMICKDGDYIIKGVQGELYPCKPDIFEQTYEKVEEDKKLIVNVIFFKPSGTLYTSEEYKVNDRDKRVDLIFNDIKLYYLHDYKGMHMVVPFTEIEGSFPMMETAGERR